jgi:RNA polymerase sigma factor (sigma-70 family)
MTGDGATWQSPEWWKAFLDLNTEVEDELRACIQKRVGRGATDEIVLKTFLRASLNAKFDPEHPRARAWLFRLARWLANDWLRSAESKLISITDLKAEPVAPEPPDPVRKLIEEERNRNLYAALARLPECQREILERFYLREEGTQAEIARPMGMTLATFNNRLNGARKALKREILMLRARGGKDGSGYDPY